MLGKLAMSLAALSLVSGARMSSQARVGIGVESSNEGEESVALKGLVSDSSDSVVADETDLDHDSSDGVEYKFDLAAADEAEVEDEEGKKGGKGSNRRRKKTKLSVLKAKLNKTKVARPPQHQAAPQSRSLVVASTLPVRCRGHWTGFSQCSAKCGGGFMQRTYAVTQQALHGGCTCPAAHGAERRIRCNVQPCPVDCQGAWTGFGQCSMKCNGGSQSRQYSVTRWQAHGGTRCPVCHGTSQSKCCNTQPCPIDCAGTWNEWGSCSASCGGGVQARTFKVSTTSLFAGKTCAAGNGSVQQRDCNQNVPCPVDCDGAWPAWTTCSKTCGGGEQFRTFAVKTPAAHGGTVCTAEHGKSIVEKCNTNPCPVDCDGSWNGFGQCTKPCGGGLQTRKFTVATQAAHGGLACEAGQGQTHTTVCNENECPIDCKGEWAEWSDCTATCGSGQQSRTFKVTSPSKFGGKVCEVANNVQTRLCAPMPCPVDCVGTWGEYDTCTATCGGGIQKRSFKVVAVAFAGGKECNAKDCETQERKCNIAPCPVDCEGFWSEYGSCTRPCGGGSQTRSFKVTRQAANGGGACSATDGHSQKQVCNSQECPIACKGTWSTWSSCSAECGGGSQIRTYKVSSTSMFGGTKCDADEGQVQKTACNPQPCPINCMGKWSDFSSCSSTCGGGTQARTFSVTMKEQHGGQACPAQDGKSESQTCADKPCPIDSEGFWDEFGTCTKTCGGGSQTRAFKVTKPAAHGGKRSESEGKTENRVCGSNECPVTCSGEFSYWGACSKSCGGGSKSRSFVVKTKASFGGGKCADDGKVEHAPCNTNPCPSNCDGSWREWGACSATCGGGKQTRTYNIKTQASYGGNACPAVTDEDRVCNPNPCPTDCEGAWTAFTQCSQTCGNGQQARTFTVTKPAQHGGSACAAENGKTEAKTCSGRPCYYR